MSFWDRYLAPGDVRNAQNAVPTLPTETIDKATQTTPPIERPPRLDAAARARRQNGLFYGGAVFSALSVIIARRAVARKTLAAGLKGASKGPNALAPKTAGGLDAFEALTFATMNVVAFGVFAAGAIAKFFDVADIEDLRDGVRRSAGYDVYGGNAQADKELEEWVAGILAKKYSGSGLKESVAEKLAELEKLEKPSK